MQTSGSKRMMIFTTILILAGLPLAAIAQSEATFKAKCAMCHGADGSANSPAGKSMGARDFRSPEVMKESEAELQQAIESGRKKMPAYKGKLSDSDIQGLVKYIRQLQGK